MSTLKPSTWSDAKYTKVNLYNGSAVEELSFVNNDDYSLFTKVEFEKNEFTGSYTVTLSQNYDDKTYRAWLDDASFYAKTMKNLGYKNIDYTSKGALVFKLTSQGQVAKLLKDLATEFTLDLPISAISKVQEFYNIINETAEQKSTLLELCYQSRTKDVDNLLKYSYGQYKNDEDKYGNKAYHIAYLKNNLDLGKVLAKNYFDINAANKYGHTVLSLAVRDGDMGWFKFAKDNYASMKHKVSSEAHSNILLLGTKAYKELDSLINTHKQYGVYDLVNKKAEYLEILTYIAKSNPDLIKDQNDNGESAWYIATTMKDDHDLYNVLVQEDQKHMNPWYSLFDWIASH
ncbi:MAG: hypothetical protein ACK5WS_03740 [Alphaproteobacteria bacterium]|jgi:hypothetical protein|nr:ankyrin repeat domain-containing protein [Candidatus Jidaibacter sp.]